jgi:hypothetical protein
VRSTSVTSEFAVLAKPVVAFRNAAPKPHMFDIADPGELTGVLAAALAGDPVPRSAWALTLRTRGAAGRGVRGRCAALLPCRQ